MCDKSQHSVYHFKSWLACRNSTMGLLNEEMEGFAEVRNSMSTSE